MLGVQCWRQAGHGHLLWVILSDALQLPSPQLLHPLDPEQEALLVAELVEADVLQVLDGDGQNVFDRAVSLGQEWTDVLIQS